MSTTNGIVNLQTGIYLNVRQEPNFYADILGTLAPNTEITIIKQNGNWFEISYNGQNAYVFSEAIKTSETIPQGGISLNLNVPNNFEFGNTGEQPTFNWNALVTTSLIPIKNESGEIQNGYSTSNGDHITIIKNNPETGLTFIQYPDQNANMYQQGWIDSSYISSKYLDFRFQQNWINTTENQKVYLFDNTISSTTLSKNTKYTLLYTVKNYGDTYACILFNENNTIQLGFVPFSTGSLNFILTNYPYDIFNETSIGSYNPTVPTNAVVNTPVQLIDINGIKPNYYIDSKGTISYPTLAANTEIAILQVFTSAEEQSMLIEYYNSNTNTYKKGYVPVNTLFNKSISINKNSVVWNNLNGTFNLMNLSNSKVIYKLPANQTIQYLYSTENFACILFNNNIISGSPLQTGFVSLSDGVFKTTQQIIDSEYSAIAKTLYFSQDNIVINANINSNIVFSHDLKKELLLKDSTGSIIATIPTTPVNWYSNNKNSYSGLQAIITPTITNNLLQNTKYNIFISFTTDKTNIVLPLKNTIPISLIHNNNFILNETTDSSIYLEKLEQPSVINQGTATIMEGYWISYGYALNIEININQTISQNNKIELTTKDKNLSVIGTNVSWYSSNKSTYNGAQFIITPEDINKLSNEETLYINLYIGNTVYNMPITSTINTNLKTFGDISYGLAVANNDLLLTTISVDK